MSKTGLPTSNPKISRCHTNPFVWFFISIFSPIILPQLNAAKTRIAAGRKDIQTYVNSLSLSLRKIGKEAIAEIQTKFRALEESVNSKKEALIEILAKKYAII
ncbi:hypothetical protein [Chryseobacterium hagamense]|uniref:hypothetical protein n=1 Tax=Chryseobacterium hagamense TaxID=395935 RepID=UPI0011BD82AE|nr:hypothetical protein [Chryseobacterium hagamense]